MLIKTIRDGERSLGKFLLPIKSKLECTTEGALIKIGKNWKAIEDKEYPPGEYEICVTEEKPFIEIEFDEPTISDLAQLVFGLYNALGVPVNGSFHSITTQNDRLAAAQSAAVETIVNYRESVVEELRETKVELLATMGEEFKKRSPTRMGRDLLASIEGALEKRAPPAGDLSEIERLLKEIHSPEQIREIIKEELAPLEDEFKKERSYNIKDSILEFIESEKKNGDRLFNSLNDVMELKDRMSQFDDSMSELNNSLKKVDMKTLIETEVRRVKEERNEAFRALKEAEKHIKLLSDILEKQHGAVIKH